MVKNKKSATKKNTTKKSVSKKKKDKSLSNKLIKKSLSKSKDKNLKKKKLKNKKSTKKNTLKASIKRKTPKKKVTKKLLKSKTKNKNFVSKNNILDYNNPTIVKEYLEKNNFDHHLRKYPHSNCFFKSLFSKNGYYKFMWFPVLILLTILILNFVIEFILFKNISLMKIKLAKNALFFSVLISTLFIINLACYFYLGSTGSAKNFRFQRIFPKILNLIFIMFVLEVILMIISYFTFMQPYLLTSFVNINLKWSYILYSIFVIFVKSVFFLITFYCGYILYDFTKFRSL